ncbi:EspA/EspE family type VII secretion system effector [Mycolicibacterium baixiangningiae]|uniref:EspA/EspE family type VII secretion system effector n=1 Tax=Mycolicibacterium baixiangningiae TaxID=2761578 RepID=UPI0018D09909|nr:EspA/EspE family type VII secretion system effector [Mycolicibacterium baixiangningiae]
MGLLGDIWRTVQDTAEKAEQAAKWVEETAEKVGLDKIAGLARNVGKFAGKLVVGPTPILQGGQKVIETMLDMAGEGDPTTGEILRDSATRFTAQLNPLKGASPDDRWQGHAANNYADRNNEQQKFVAMLADADSQIRDILHDEARDVLHMRRELERQHNWLADFGQFSQWIGRLGPEGKAAQISMETWAVAMAVPPCVRETYDMSQSANDNATEIRMVKENLYEKVAQQATISDSLNDFDPPRRTPRAGPPAPGGAVPGGQIPHRISRGGPPAPAVGELAPALAASAPGAPAAPATTTPASYALPTTGAAPAAAPATPRVANAASSPRNRAVPVTSGAVEASGDEPEAASGRAGGRAPVATPAVQSAEMKGSAL